MLNNTFNSDEIVKKLKKYPVLSHFSEAILSDLVAQSEKIEVPADYLLFSSKEDRSDYLYYIVEGSVEVFSSDTFERKVAVIRSGEMLGDGLTTKTLRASRLLQIQKEVFLKFFKKEPELLLDLAQTMSRRIRHMITSLQEKHYAFKNVVLLFLSPTPNLSQIKNVFQAAALADQTKIYDKSDFYATGMEIVSFSYRCEDNPGVNLFLVENDRTPWSRAMMVNAEYVYLIISEDMEDSIDKEILEDIKKKPCDIVIYHATKEFPYKNTKNVCKQYNFTRYHHITDNEMDYQRLYRYMTGQAIGLVISGGGFRSYVYYGLVKALFESRIPIDCIAGSSMGATIGSLLAINFDWEYFSNHFEKAMEKLRSRRLFQFTFPIYSVLSGKIITDVLKEMFGEYRIEDLPLNFFCIVTNLSKRKKEIKVSGKLWEWLKATTAVPGVFPPFEKKGKIYVDGAVCTNLPVQEMRDYLNGAGTIITFNIGLPSLPQDKYTCPPSLTWKEALAYKLGLSGKKYVFPSLIDILLECSSINQYIYDIQGAEKAEIIIAPDTSSLSFLDPRKGNPLNLEAWDLATQKLAEKKYLYQRWLKD